MKVRQDGQIPDVVVMIASGIDPQGRWQILGVSLSDQEVHWRAFLQSLATRVKRVHLITSEDHGGLPVAQRSVFGCIPWQPPSRYGGCQIYLQQYSSAYEPWREMLHEVAVDLLTFYAPDRPTAEAYLARTVQKYEHQAAKLADWLEKNIPEGLTVFDFPAEHLRRIRINNSLKQVNREIARRTKVVCIFPNEMACLQLPSAILLEIDEEWQSGRAYLTFEREGAQLTT